MLRNKIQGLEATDPHIERYSLAERRRRVRVRCYVRVRLDRAGTGDKAIVTDIGMEGVRLKTALPLETNDQVVIIYPEEHPGGELGKVACRVVWVQQVRDQIVAGLTYSDTRDNMRRSWVKFVLEELGFDESRTFQKRKFIRAEGTIPARLHDTEVTKGRVLNLGLGGALLESPQPMEVGHEVDLEICLWRILPALSLRCQVLQTRQEHPGGPYLHSLLFMGLDADQVKLLGNYVIYLINQTSL